ncbi:MAG: HlyD family efflux transporter periplasmic adaptor subunit [Clostridia bacterium]|nr:HlyD family efflux transporter periplasmic adaptor subunit [Clostridia bacterium]
MKKKRKKLMTWVIIIVFLVAAGYGSYRLISNSKDAAKESATTLTRRTSTVLLGDVEQSISASGILEASITTDYKASSQGELVELTVKDGDYVEKGSLLASMDTSALDDKIENYNNQINDYIDKIETANNDITDIKEDISDTYEKINEKKDEIAELESDIDDLNDSKSELTIYAPFSGVIFDVKVDVGTVVNDGTVMATLTDTKVYEAELAIRAKAFTGNIQSVYVYYKNTKYEATIISHADFTYKDQFGNELVDVIFRFSMDSGIPDKEKVHAIITTDNINYYSYADAEPYYAISESIKSTLQGEILSLNAVSKKAVSEGEVLAVLDSSYLEDKIDSINSQIETVNSQIDTFYDQVDTYNDQIDSKLKTIADYEDSINDLYTSIEEVNAEYSDLQILADYNGIISNVSASAGDTVSTNLVLFTLTSMDQPKIKVSIDELDISKIKKEMEASVVIDALEATSAAPVSAMVTEIATTGKSSGGVTTYSVTVSLAEPVEGLMLSMNATATIYINKSENTLYVPIEAVTVMGGKKFVYVQTGEADSPVVDNTTESAIQSKNGFTGRGNIDTSQMTDEQRAAMEERIAQIGGTFPGSTAPAESSATSLQDYYAGSSLVEVTTGVYNESYIEILSGVEKGQVIVLPPTYTSSSATTDQATGNIMGFGGIGGMTGGGTGRVPGANGGFTGGGQ